jgi:hypothetical protein
MAISEHFKLLDLNKFFWRKLCTDEVGGAKMKKMKITCFAIRKKRILLFLWLCISKMICRA